MKRVTLGFSVLALSTAFVLSCKPEKNEPPVADTETQSAVFASFANYVASDIEMACSFMGENAYNTTFYSEYPGSSSGNTGTVSIIRDTTNIVIDGKPHDQLVMAWNSTRCIDGNFRDGSIFMYVPQIPNQRYSRDFKFQGRINLSNYKVNGWLIELYDPGAPVYLYNTLASSNYSTTTTKLTWRFAGKLKFTHPTDPQKNMIWDGQLFKTLENTSNPAVFAPSKQAAITWSNAVISYSAKVTGTVPKVDDEGKVIEPNVGFDLTVDGVRPLVRDFKCSPDKVSGVTFAPTGTVVQLGDEHHPFKTGVASFTVGTAYPRQIYYGNEGEPQLDIQCDNTGEVLIKGTSYKVNFMK